MRRIAKANQSSAAIHNRRLAVQLLRQHGTLSRRQLAQITGLRTSTLTYIVRDLIEQNIVRTVGKAESKTVGKKQILLEINPGLGWVVGVGLETDMASLVYVDASGEMIDRERIEIGHDVNVVPVLLRSRIDAWAMRNKKDTADLLGVGVGVPGVVDSARGRVLRSTWFTAEDLPLQALITEQMDTNVIVDNDANFAALGESRLGSARGLTNFVYFLMNAQVEQDHFAIRGLGTTIFLDGSLYRGSHFAAGEVDTRLEAERYADISREHMQLLASEDEPLNDVMTRLALQTGRTLTAVVDLIDPQAVVLGGNPAIANKQMIAEIGRVMNNGLVNVPNREVAVRPSQLGDIGVSMGAAVAVIDAALRGDDLAEDQRDHQQILFEVLGGHDAQSADLAQAKTT